MTTHIYLPDIGAFGFRGPGDDTGDSQSRLTSVPKIRRIHLPGQRLDILQNGHLDLKEKHMVEIIEGR